MNHAQYLVLMGLCLLVTLPLELLLGARVYRRPVRAVLAIAPTVAVFVVWDTLAFAGGAWTYSARFISGITLPFGLPIEELVFFVVIPLCALLTFETVGRLLRRIRGRRPGGDRDA